MRASSLSRAKVIDLLNSYFVPVSLRNQDFDDKGAAPAEEKSEKARIYRDALKAGMHAGSVCVYLVSPEGRPMAVAPANEDLVYDPDRLAELMSQVVRQLDVVKAGPSVAAEPHSPAPRESDGSLVLHIVARYLERKGDECVPYDVKAVLGTKDGGNWANLPSQEWVVLSRPEWTGLLPRGEVRVDLDLEAKRGRDREAAATLLSAHRKHRPQEEPRREARDSSSRRIDRARNRACAARWTNADETSILPSR